MSDTTTDNTNIHPSDPRSRFVFKEWPRDPKGKLLTKPGPVGKRSPNGIIWGHMLADFFWIRRIPNVNVMTVWSRSMIQEFGENYMNEQHTFEPEPRRLRPWPVLKLPVGCIENGCSVGVVDEGCDSEHSRVPQPRVDDIDYRVIKSSADGTELVDRTVMGDTDHLSEATKVMTDILQTNGVENPLSGSIVTENSNELSSHLEQDATSNWSQVVSLKSPPDIQCKEEPVNSILDSVREAEESLTKPYLEDGVDTPEDLASSKEVELIPTRPATPEPAPAPKLEEHIPKEFFPDILLVNDPNGSTQPVEYGYRYGPLIHNKRTPIKYKRVWPKLPRDTKPETALNTDPNCASVSFPTDTASTPTPSHRISHLNLALAPLLGVGHHSEVHRASLRLPSPLSAFSPSGEVTVAAKTAFRYGEARKLLHNEGKVYDSFPEHLMEDWCGHNLVTPIMNPVPVAAVVPKFFGYYVPIKEDAAADKREERKAKKRAQQLEESEKAHKEKEITLNAVATAGEVGDSPTSSDAVSTETISVKETKNDRESTSAENCPSNDLEDEDGEDFEDDENHDELSPILLLEECGTPVEPSKFTADARSACYSLLLRLHQAEFTHNSFYVRNILVQPGPLTSPPSLRSDKTPSFRIIDFGRSNCWKTFLEDKMDNGTPKSKFKEAKCVQEISLSENDKREIEKRRHDKMVRAAKDWLDLRDYDTRKAQEELRILNFDF